MTKQYLITRKGSNYYGSGVHTDLVAAEKDAIKETRRINEPHQVLQVVAEFEPKVVVDRVGVSHD